MAAWIEFLLLRRWLDARIGVVPIPVRLGLGAAAAAIVAGAAGFGASELAATVTHHTVIISVAAIAVFGVVYLGAMAAANVPEAGDFVRRFTRRRRGAP